MLQSNPQNSPYPILIDFKMNIILQLLKHCLNRHSNNTLKPSLNSINTLKTHHHLKAKMLRIKRLWNKKRKKGKNSQRKSWLQNGTSGNSSKRAWIIQLFNITKTKKKINIKESLKRKEGFVSMLTQDSSKRAIAHSQFQKRKKRLMLTPKSR